MHFRPATLAEIPVLRNLAQRIWRACYPGIVSVEQIEFMLAQMYSEETIRAEFARGVAWELIGDDAGAGIGFLSYHLESDSRVKLNKLYLLPEQQGRGIGAAALSRVMQAAAALGAKSVWMQVNKRNHRAVAVYRKAGFHIAQEAVFDIGNGFVMDDYLMEKQLLVQG